jgi:16S rRNA (guanine1516-N2)-methyltransferase
MQVMDATAGFGHDSLILASTGVRDDVSEQQPLMALLLAEQQRMSEHTNWQNR